MKKYRVTLTAAERDELEQMLARGKADVRRLKHAQVLLKADQAEGGPAWPDERIVAALNVGIATVQRLRQRFVLEGLQAAQPVPGRPAALSAQARWRAGGQADCAGLLHATRRARALDAAPAGRTHGRAAARRHALARDRATDTEKKNALKPHLRKMWCIPPKQRPNLSSTWKMYWRCITVPYDAKRPVLCIDETFKQLIGETRKPLPLRPGMVERYDHEYVRNGVAGLFLAGEPLAGWRHVAVTEHRGRVDLGRLHPAPCSTDATRRRERSRAGYGPARRPRARQFVRDIPPDDAKRLAERIELDRTPKHGSWLNIAEIELSALGRQCLARRIAHQDSLRRKVEQWEQQRNAAVTKVDWQFTTAQARVKLRSLYPSLHA